MKLKLLLTITLLPLLGCTTQSDASTCPKPIANGSASIVASYSSGKCGYPLRDSANRFWVNSTDYYRPKSASKSLSLECRIHFFSTSRSGVNTFGGQVYVNSKTGNLTRKLPASCDAYKILKNGGRLSVPGQ